MRKIPDRRKEKRGKTSRTFHFPQKNFTSSRGKKGRKRDGRGGRKHREEGKGNLAKNKKKKAFTEENRLHKGGSEKKSRRKEAGERGGLGDSTTAVGDTKK